MSNAKAAAAASSSSSSSSLRKKIAAKLKGSSSSLAEARETVDSIQAAVTDIGFTKPDSVVVALFVALAFFVEALHLPFSKLRRMYLERLALPFVEDLVSSPFFFFSFLQKKK
jgi:hypothetical protein